MDLFCRFQWETTCAYLDVTVGQVAGLLPAATDTENIDEFVARARTNCLIKTLLIKRNKAIIIIIFIIDIDGN